MAPAEYKPGYERVAGEILRFIAEAGLRPGEKALTEAEFASRLGVSRAQVREAIKILAALGRVRVRKGLGVVVADPAEGLLQAAFGAFVPVDIDDVASLFGLRVILETESARLASNNAGPLEVRQIVKHAEACMVAAEADDFDAFRGADTAFHCAVADGSHNRFLASLMRVITELRRQVIDVGLQGGRSGPLAEAAAEHMNVARYITRGEEAAAAMEMRRHVEVALRQYRSLIRQRVSGFEE